MYNLDDPKDGESNDAPILPSFDHDSTIIKGGNDHPDPAPTSPSTQTEK